MTHPRYLPIRILAAFSHGALLCLRAELTLSSAPDAPRPATIAADLAAVDGALAMQQREVRGLAALAPATRRLKVSRSTPVHLCPN